MIAYDRNIPETEMVLQYRCYECGRVGFVKYTKPIEYEEDFKLAIPDGWDRVKVHGTKYMGWKDGTEDRMVYVCDVCLFHAQKEARKSEDKLAFKRAIENLQYDPEAYHDTEIMNIAYHLSDLRKLVRMEAERRGMLDKLVRDGILEREKEE